jgi:cyclopropane fatty-acyl-phospholipid synthase-like methyltransferase
MTVADDPTWDAAYEGTPPWDIGRPQTAFVDLAERGQLRGHVLDVGCGTGEHALLAAAHGMAATGVDLSPRALRTAQQKAAERRLDARFIVHDARRLAELGAAFETVLDCGLFHVFDDTDRAAYVESLRHAVVIGGRYHLLCFSDQQPGDWGPRRVTEAEIRASFRRGWAIESMDRVTLDITIDPAGARAWFVTLSRVADETDG